MNVEIWTEAAQFLSGSTCIGFSLQCTTVVKGSSNEYLYLILRVQLRAISTECIVKNFNKSSVVAFPPVSVKII